MRDGDLTRRARARRYARGMLLPRVHGGCGVLLESRACRVRAGVRAASDCIPQGWGEFRRASHVAPDRVPSESPPIVFRQAQPARSPATHRDRLYARDEAWPRARRLAPGPAPRRLGDAAGHLGRAIDTIRLP